jgi:hypothetical protein
VAGALIASGAPAGATAAQGSGCSQPLTTTTAAEGSYSIVNIRDFAGRVYLYVPAIRSSSKGTFAQFQLWVVEGVYGRPFVQTSGSLDQATFDRLRKSTNVRATGVSVARSGESKPVTIARQPFLLEIAVRVAASGSDSVTVKVCRGR